MKLRLSAFILCLLLTGCNFQKDINNTVDATTGLGDIKQAQQAIKDLAEAQAREIYRQNVSLGTDLTSGPCLSEHLIDDWALDIVHNPRTTVDDEPSNQCQSYLQGKTHHFIELDLQGNLLKMQ